MSEVSVYMPGYSSQRFTLIGQESLVKASASDNERLVYQWRQAISHDLTCFDGGERITENDDAAINTIYEIDLEAKAWQKRCIEAVVKSSADNKGLLISGLLTVAPLDIEDEAYLGDAADLLEGEEKKQYLLSIHRALKAGRLQDGLLLNLNFSSLLESVAEYITAEDLQQLGWVASDDPYFDDEFELGSGLVLNYPVGGYLKTLMESGCKAALDEILKADYHDESMITSVCLRLKGEAREKYLLSKVGGTAITMVQFLKVNQSYITPRLVKKLFHFTDGFDDPIYKEDFCKFITSLAEAPLSLLLEDEQILCALRSAVRDGRLRSLPLFALQKLFCARDGEAFDFILPIAFNQCVKGEPLVWGQLLCSANDRLKIQIFRYVLQMLRRELSNYSAEVDFITSRNMKSFSRILSTIPWYFDDPSDDELRQLKAIPWKHSSFSVSHITQQHIKDLLSLTDIERLIESNDIETCRRILLLRCDDKTRKQVIQLIAGYVLSKPMDANRIRFLRIMLTVCENNFKDKSYYRELLKKMDKEYIWSRPCPSTIFSVHKACELEEEKRQAEADLIRFHVMNAGFGGGHYKVFGHDKPVKASLHRINKVYPIMIDIFQQFVKRHANKCSPAGHSILKACVSDLRNSSRYNTHKFDAEIDVERMNQQLDADEVVSLASGWSGSSSGHDIRLSLFKINGEAYLAYANRGQRREGIRSGITFFKIKKRECLNDLGMIKKLLCATSTRKYLESIDSAEENTLGGDFGLEEVAFIEKSPQKVGNCVLASCNNAILINMMVKRLQQTYIRGSLNADHIKCAYDHVERSYKTFKQYSRQVSRDCCRGFARLMPADSYASLLQNCITYMERKNAQLKLENDSMKNDGPAVAASEVVPTVA